MCKGETEKNYLLDCEFPLNLCPHWVTTVNGCKSYQVLSFHFSSSGQCSEDPSACYPAPGRSAQLYLGSYTSLLKPERLSDLLLRKLRLEKQLHSCHKAEWTPKLSFLKTLMISCFIKVPTWKQAHRKCPALCFITLQSIQCRHCGITKGTANVGLPRNIFLFCLNTFFEHALKAKDLSCMHKE